MSQSRWMSLVESVTNIAVGYVVAVTAQAVIFPLYGIHIPPSSHATIGALFTVVSLVRSFLLRRYFNLIGSKQR